MSPFSLSGERPPMAVSAGAVLAASGPLNDPNFASTVVLVCQCGAEGAYGLVLNRPAHMPLAEIFEQPPDVPGGKTRRVYIGGPVQPEELQILQIGEPAPGALRLAPEVHLGGAWNDLGEILAREPRHLRLFLGYSGWAGGQLEREVELGAWEVCRPNLKKLLLSPEEAWMGGAGEFKKFLATL